MTKLADKILRKFYRPEDHPNRILERRIAQKLRPEFTILDAGCGYTAPVLSIFKGKARRLIGVDVIDFKPTPLTEGLELIKGNLESMAVESGSVDLLFSRSVMEHVVNPSLVYREFHRVLKPGGRVIFLTANFWDYVSLIASVVPNRYHGWIVSKTEGRAAEDTFPTAYKTNTRYAIGKHAEAAGFDLSSLEYLGQYPSMFLFNGPLFFLGVLYDKLLANVPPLAFLRGWILAEMVKR